MILFVILALEISLVASDYSYKNPHWWENRSTIVHLFEWKWNDIADECERFLQHKGYAGVQVSPPNENVVLQEHPWWERYQPISYKLVTRSGDEADFLDMTTRCNAVGIRIYVDAIVNHMSRRTVNQTGTAGGQADPINMFYPSVPYSSWDFHSVCHITNWDYQNNATAVRSCQLEKLNDLDQGKNHVRAKIIEYLNHLIDLGVAGFRIDAAKHMWPSDLNYIYNNLKNLNTSFGFMSNSKPFIYQEVIDLGGEAVRKEEYVHFGVVTEFGHSNELGRVFRKNDKLTYLSNWGKEWGLLDSHNAFVFIDNHDNQRDNGVVLTYKQSKEYKMAIAFMLAHTYGIPRVMSSFAFEYRDQGPPLDSDANIISPSINPDDTCGNGWICEHRWRQIYNMVGFRNAVRGTTLNDWWSNGDQQIAFCRGRKGFVAFTNWGDLRQTLQTCLPAAVYCDIISGKVDENGQCTGKVVQVGNDGRALIELYSSEYDGVLAIHINAKQYSK